MTPFKLADDDRATPTEEDLARRMIVGAEVDEAAQRPLGADDVLDDQLVQAILHRQDKSVISEKWRQRPRRIPRMLRLRAEHNRHVLALDAIGQASARFNPELVYRARDCQAAQIDRRDMFCDDINEVDIVAAANQIGAQCAADGAGAPYQDCHQPQSPSSKSRVSSTATCQIASMSASGR